MRLESSQWCGTRAGRSAVLPRWSWRVGTRVNGVKRCVGWIDGDRGGCRAGDVRGEIEVQGATRINLAGDLVGCGVNDCDLVLVILCNEEGCTVAAEGHAVGIAVRSDAGD